MASFRDHHPIPFVSKFNCGIQLQPSKTEHEFLLIPQSKKYKMIRCLVAPYLHIYIWHWNMI